MNSDTARHFANVKRWALFWPTEAASLAALDCSSVTFCHSANGELNLKKAENGQAFYLHSEENPSKEAKKWFSELPLKNIKVLYVYGIGLGYYYEAAWEWLREDSERTLIFFEDDLEVISRLFETDHGTNLLHDQQVILQFWNKKIDADSNNALDTFLSNFSIYEYFMSALNSYENFRAVDTSKIKSQISFFSVLNKASTSEYSLHGVSFFNNFFRNLLYLPDSYLADSLFGKFTGIPAIICGAGPSLEKNVKVLETLKDRALIFAGGTALNALNVHGIVPHFGVGIDPNQDHFNRLVMNHAYETPFLYRNRMLHDAFRMIHGDKLFLTGSGGYDIPGWFEKNLDIDGSNLNEGCNVLNFSLSIAHAMGCNPIIFVGVDLAYSQGHSYAQGLISHPIHDRKSSFRTKYGFEELVLKTDIYGESIYTLWKWIAEALWYSKYAAVNNDILMINATEGGLGFPNVINAPLSIVADTYLTKHYDFGTLIHGEIQNSYLPSKVTKQKIQELMLELSEGLHRCWLHCHTLYVEFNTALVKAKETKEYNFAETRAKCKEIESQLYNEPAYIHFLKVFNEAYLRAYGYETLRIQSDEGLLPQYEIDAKKIKFDSLRFHFLKQTALINSSLIQEVIRENEEQQTAAQEWANRSKEVHEKFGGGPAKLVEDPALSLSKVPFDPEEGRYVQYYPGGALKLELFYQNGTLQGPSTFYAEDGTILAKSVFADGKQEGTAWTYYPSGALHSLQRFQNGQWEGKQHYFYPDGSPKTVLIYTNGLLNGRVLLYYPQGRPKRSLNFVNGKRNGIETLWDEKGLITIEAEYLDDHPVGVARGWHSNGTLIKEVTYEDQTHRCTIKRWNPNGIPIEQEELFEDDYFDKVAKHTGQLTDTLEEVYNQINKVVPILTDKIDENKQEEVKAQSKADLQKDFHDLKHEMERLRSLSEELKVESNLNADNAVEPLWKSPSTQREVEKQLESLKQTMSQEISNIEKGLKNVMDELLKKTEKPPKNDDNNK